MKSFLFVAAICSLFVVIASAQTSKRQTSIERIERSYLQATVLSLDSAFVDTVLRSAKATNPTVSPETWQSLKPEFVSALNKALSADGGQFGGVLNTALTDLSDDQAEHLATLLDDPVLLKFQAAVANPVLQRQMMQRTSALVLQVGAAINSVLSAHGLKEIH